MPLQPPMAVTTADMQRHTSQLEMGTPNTPEAQDIAHRDFLHHTNDDRLGLVDLFNQVSVIFGRSHLFLSVTQVGKCHHQVALGR